GGKSRAHMFLQFTCERFSRRESRFEYNECLDDLGALRIRRPYDRSHAHGGMAQQAVFDGSRPDAIARTGNDVVVAADERYVALRVLRAGIAGDEPVTDEFFPGCLGIVPVAKEHDRIGAMHRNRTDFARGHYGPIVIDDFHFMSGSSLADGAGLRRE